MPSNFQEFSLYVGKQFHKIDAQTLADSLSALSPLLVEINRDFETGKKLELKVS